MSTTQFDRDSMARWYASQHLSVDPGIAEVYYLPDKAPEREIRFIEVNMLSADQGEHELEPVDFRVDIGTENFHQLFVLDVTPAQWDRIVRHDLALPAGWSLTGYTRFAEK